MAGFIVSFASTKGGTGKSTLATNVALRLIEVGYRVGLADLDIQRSSWSWYAERKERDWSVDGLAVRQLTGRGVGRELVEMAEEFDFVLADCPGMHAGELSIAVCASHLVVVPARPGLFDAVGLESIVDVLGQTVARSVEGRRILIVLSQMPTARRSRDARELRELLAQDENAEDFDLLTMRVARTEVQSRVAYPRATEQGKGVVEWNDAAAKGQIRRLVDEMLDELSEEEGNEA